MKDNNELYKLIGDTIDKLQKEEIPFQKFLDVKAKFSKYSTANTLLILAQMPKAKMIKDSLTWERESVKISKKAIPIYILEPNFNDEDTVISYNSKKMYDVSQTNYKQKQIKYDNRTILKAFLHNSIAKIEATDDFEEADMKTRLEVTSGKNVIYIRRGMNFNEIFEALSKELTSIEFTDEVDKEMNDFKSKAISYLVCKNVGVNIHYPFEKLPEAFKEKNNMSAREDLIEISTVANKISEGMVEYLRQANVQDKKRGFLR